jgi:(p)ppGpp synthase/HD superfamily hydrolase
MPNIERALEIAARVHRDQTDKAGRPYVLHPIALMMQFDDEPAQLAALLHDTIEDSEKLDPPVTAESLRAEGFSEEVVTAVVALTVTPDESDRGKAGYFDFVRRAAKHPIARRVKLADIEHNMDLKRIASISAKDLKRIEKYHEARAILLGHTD